MYNYFFIFLIKVVKFKAYTCVNVKFDCIISFKCHVVTRKFNMLNILLVLNT